MREVRARLDLNAPRPVHLYSTQVIEAGVHLDFPRGYRALGPLDRMAQTAGRVNREGRRSGKGRVTLFIPEGERLPPSSEYRSGRDQARVLLRQGADLNDPQVFEQYFLQLYRAVNTDEHCVLQKTRELAFAAVAEVFRLITDETVPVVIRYGPVVDEVL